MKIIILVFVSCLAARELKFIEVISRHGVRQPLYPNTYDNSNRQNHNNGALTIQGKSMHYLLGKGLYQRYWQQLFNNTIYQHSYDQSIIYAKSTNLDRTIQSLQAQLYGLLQNLQKPNQAIPTKYYFPPFPINNKGYNFNEKQAKTISSLFTFPIHVEQGAEGSPANQHYEGDYLIKLFQNLCPNQKIWKEQNFKTALAKRIQDNEKIRTAINKLRTVYNSNNITIQNAYQYIDNYICLKANNQSFLPIFEDPSIKDALQFLYVQVLYLTNFYTEQQRKTFSTTLISTTIFNIKEAIAGNGPKIVLLSAHDTTIATLLAAMNFSSIECIVQKYLQGNDDVNCYSQYPTFGSSFIFQVWEQNSQYLINIMINGVKYNIPICNYQQQCSLHAFQAWFQTFKVQSPNQQCGLVNQWQIQYSYLIFFCAGFLLALVTIKIMSWQYTKSALVQFQLVNSQILYGSGGNDLYE